MKLYWFTKSKRAQNVDDNETWQQGGAVPTLNAFDVGDTRATVLILGVDFYNATTDERNFHTLRSGGANEGKPGVLIFDGTRVDDVRVYEDEIAPTVISRYGTGGGNVPIVALQGNMIGRADTAGPQGKGFTEEGEPMFTLTKTDVHAVASSTVRRLTPMECERLQGFPDNWTDGQTDGHRYKQMGNAVAVPVVSWIVNRLMGAANDLD